MAQNASSRAADPAAAASALGQEIIADNSTAPQIFNVDGERLSARRCRVFGAPRLASPSWYRLAADGWLEVPR
jgi:hypothetical protein